MVATYSSVIARGGASRRTHTGFGFGADSAAHLDEHDEDTDVYTLMYSSGTSGVRADTVRTVFIHPLRLYSAHYVPLYLLVRRQLHKMHEVQS